MTKITIELEDETLELAKRQVETLYKGYTLDQVLDHAISIGMMALLTDKDKVREKQVLLFAEAAAILLKNPRTKTEPSSTAKAPTQEKS